ncbi:MAG TPA: GIY-YIG nuclease family protein [Candidatus Paceibacterota bacterium]
MNAYVYILQDTRGKFYIGSTNDLERRLNQHKRGHTYTTRRMETPILVFSQAYDTLKDARFVERKIKALKRKDYIEKIIKDGYIKINPKKGL